MLLTVSNVQRLKIDCAFFFCATKQSKTKGEVKDFRNSFNVKMYKYLIVKTCAHIDETQNCNAIPWNWLTESMFFSLFAFYEAAHRCCSHEIVTIELFRLNVLQNNRTSWKLADDWRQLHWNYTSQFSAKRTTQLYTSLLTKKKKKKKKWNRRNSNKSCNLIKI